MKIYLLIMTTLIASCGIYSSSNKHVDTIVVNGMDDVEKLKSSWNARKIESYKIVYKNVNWASTCFTEITVRGGKFKKGLWYCMRDPSTKYKITEKDGNMRTMSELINRIGESRGDYKCVYYANGAFNMIASYTCDSGHEDDWHTISVVRLERI